MFLLVGIMLLPSITCPQIFSASDRIYPTFIITQMRTAFRMLIAAILAAAMSNLSAALNSLSSSSIIDFYLQRHPQVDELRSSGCRGCDILVGVTAFGWRTFPE